MNVNIHCSQIFLCYFHSTVFNLHVHRLSLFFCVCCVPVMWSTMTHVIFSPGPGVLVVVFGLCWAPFHVDRLVWSYIDTSSDQHLQIFEHVHIISGVFFYLSSAINPILYNLMSTRFREMFNRMTCYSNNWQMHSSSQMTQRSTLSEKTPSTKQYKTDGSQTEQKNIIHMVTN